MPVTLTQPAGSATSDGYTDALTLGPTSQLETVQFTVTANTVLAQVWKLNRAGKPILDPTELPFAPGQWGLDKIAGIRFRSAIAGAPGNVNVIGYYGDDAVPFGNASVLPSSSLSIFGGTLLNETVSRRVGGFTQQGVDFGQEAYLISSIDQELLAGTVYHGAAVFMSQKPTASRPAHNSLILVDELTLTVRAICNGFGDILAASNVGYVKLPFSAPYTVLKDGFYYAGFAMSAGWGVGTSPGIQGISEGLTGPTEVSSGLFPRPSAMLNLTPGVGNPGVGTVLPAGNANSDIFWIGLY